jgi:predicted TPR repeat methyltransferase
VQPVPASSGDLLVDRRFSYALGLMDAEDWTAASALLSDMTALAPSWPHLWFTLGQALRMQGDTEGARQAFDRARVLDPEDAAGAGAELARMGDPSQGLSPAFVRTLFDQYADRFETHLVDQLGYRGPELMMAMLYKACDNTQSFQRGIDLGCGTGLMGKALDGRVAHLTGVDLAPRMVARAEASGIYQATVVADAVAFLKTRTDHSHDLICAADVLPYLGDLTDFFAESARVLTPGGVLLATAQSCDGEMFLMGDDLRFHHSAPYLANMISKASFNHQMIDACAKRMDRGQPVASWVLCARREAA